jgi:hypothetical protein
LALSEAGLFAGGGLIKDKVGCKQQLIDVLVLFIAIGYLLCKYVTYHFLKSAGSFL